METNTVVPDSNLAQYWREYFQDRHARRDELGMARSLAYSNEMVQTQTYSAVLEGAGPLYDRTVWDAGCGWGALSLILHACGAVVTASDIVAETVVSLQSKYEFINWRTVDITDEHSVRQLPLFDCVIACEVLQHVKGSMVLPSLWQRVRRGGRLTGCVSNSNCPIVMSVVDRLPGVYYPLCEKEIRTLGASLPDASEIHVKGLAFRSNQSFQPYFATDWNSPEVNTANRLVFTILKRNADTDA